MNYLRTIIVVLLLTFTSIQSGLANSYAELSAAVVEGNWARAQPIARELDAAEPGSEFFSLYVAVSETVSKGNCDIALPLLTLMARAKPYFVPTYELSYICHKRVGDNNGAVADLSAIIAILPAGPQRDLVRQMLASDQAGDGIGISFYGSITPSSNANRQTTATTLNGFVLTKASQAQMGINAQAGVSLTKNFFANNGVFVAGVVRAELNYSSVTQLISPRLFLEIPVSFTPMANTQATLTPYATFEFSQLSHTATHIGVRGVVSHTFDSSNQVTLQTSVARDDYVNATYLNGWSSDTVLAWAHTFDANTRLTSKATLLADIADNNANTRLDASLSARVDHLMDAGLLIGLEGTVGRRFHNKPPPLSAGPNQTDTYLRGTVELSHKDIVFGPLMPTLTYTYQRQFSDNIFYDYQSHDIGISLRAKL